MSQAAGTSNQLIEQASRIIAGKSEQIKLIWVSLLCNGHVLLEDLPGVGKTTLAQTLATLLGLSYQRVQFTADLLPSDVIGAQIYDREQQSFYFHKGPVFTQLLLADELNRATPKAQSALLEAMEERQVSVDGDSKPLPSPFFVIATQNPQSQSGTYPLPESQLDRFFVRISLGYPDESVEKELLKGSIGRHKLQELLPIITSEQWPLLQKEVIQVSTSDAVLNYIMRLVKRTRDGEICALGLSPRASQSLAMAAKAYALISNRDYVIPDDVQAVFPAVAGHRLKACKAQNSELLVQRVLDSVAVIEGA
ncbi:AAA family ATPase [Reinekea sp.]|jgi:MoxR-like ATPase|uniref:AAA family ATPase n=1 Tax=Reinekea sp. TaxID=1970455 RepID=UPI00398A2C94